jgi:hypothetical protein
MKTSTTLTRILSLLLSTVLVAGPVFAQQRRPASPPPAKAQPNAATPTFDTLLAAESYKLYGEVRNVGQAITSGGIADILDPIMKLAGPPKEFKALVKFANTHAEALTSSRLLFAMQPARPNLPQFLMAIEFSTPDEAQKFEPQLTAFLPKLMPTPTPSPSPSPTTTAEGSSASGSAPQAQRVPAIAAPDEQRPAPPPFLIKHSGNLVIVTDTPFTFANLRPKDSKLLSEETNFRQAHDRFATEPLFVFFDMALSEKTSRALAAAARVQPRDDGDGNELSDTSATRPVRRVVVGTMRADKGTSEAVVAPNPQTPTPPPQVPVATPQVVTTLEVTPLPDETGVSAMTDSPDSAVPPSPLVISASAFSLMGLLVGGQSKSPDALGIAVAFDSDGYAVRVLLLNSTEARTPLIPFIPSVMSGPALALGSPSILPADTELFIAASLDAAQSYEGLVKASNESFARDQAMYRRAGSGGPAPEPPFAAFEKQLGIKIKEELLPVLGNEIAVSIPVTALTPSASSPPPATSSSDQPAAEEAAKKHPPGPVIVISLKDKEGARALIPRIIDGLGFKGASGLAQTERHDDAEIVTYANVLSYAFIGNFFVFSTDAATTRHVVDSFLNHQTLASDNHFRNYTRWQPRQVVGQVYVSPALMDSYRSMSNQPTALVNDQIREFLMRLSPIAEPVTYALSNEGPGTLHELHLPKNLVLMLVAGVSSVADQSPLMRNEGMARGSLAMIASFEGSYRADKGKGSYATLDQLIAEGMVQKELLENYGYRIELTVSGDKFEATAVPVEYNKTGKLSYFIDQTMIVRAGDHGGGPANASDQPLQ